MRKKILIFFLLTLISSKKFLGLEILSEELDDDIALQKPENKGISLFISIPKPVAHPRSNPVKVNPTPVRVRLNQIKVKPNINIVITQPSTTKIKTTREKTRPIPVRVNPIPIKNKLTPIKKN